jgi:hypothetical protein
MMLRLQRLQLLTNRLLMRLQLLPPLLLQQSAMHRLMRLLLPLPMIRWLETHLKLLQRLQRLLLLTRHLMRLLLLLLKRLRLRLRLQLQLSPLILRLMLLQLLLLQSLLH